jgi:hypothetical protein
MASTDALLARLQGEVEERTQFMDGLVEAAEKDKRDLNEQEMTLLTRTRERITKINEQIEPLQLAAQIAVDSRRRTAEIAEQFEKARDPEAAKKLEYRSAGAYILERWKAGLGDKGAEARIDLYHRAAAHQTTTDNPGLIPEPIIGPVVNFIDGSRPLVSTLGARQLPSSQWSRPRVTQHTQTGPQAGEKTELVSRKMIVGSVPVTAKTYGGYVNVSRQNVDWSQPAVMDLIINDLAAQYAIETESVACADFATAATAGPVLPTGTPTSDEVLGALWAAAASVLAATAGQGRLFAAAPPQMMGLLGPLFPPVNPQNASSAGFTVGSLGPGVAGAIAGIPIVVTNGLANNTILVLSSAAAEVYEDRIGSLQVVEPSVLGVQVAYAGYFADLPLEPAGIVKVTKTP